MVTVNDRLAARYGTARVTVAPGDSLHTEGDVEPGITVPAEYCGDGDTVVRIVFVDFPAVHPDRTCGGCDRPSCDHSWALVAADGTVKDCSEQR